MRIALVHSFYRSDLPSGENVSVLELQSALRRAGHDVLLVRRDSDDLGLAGSLRAGFTVATGSGPTPIEALREFAPDVTHVHNLFPNFGQSWVRKWNGPLVATLHNFRTLCVRGTLFRADGECTLCPDGTSWNAVRHRCYRRSAIASVPWSMSRDHGARNPLVQRADRIIVLSERSRATFERYGIDGRKVAVVPNGMAALAPARPASAPNTWIALGRLDPGKGLRTLVRDWPETARLDIVGDGPLGEELRASAHGQIRLLGMRDRAWIREHLPGYTGLVFPSRLAENSPVTVVEALSCGVPVVARAGSAGADVVARIEPRWVYEGADPAPALSAVAAAGSMARTSALAAYDAAFGADQWVSRVEAVYEAAR